MGGRWREGLVPHNKDAVTSDRRRLLEWLFVRNPVSWTARGIDGLSATAFAYRVGVDPGYARQVRCSLRRRGLLGAGSDPTALSFIPRGW
jgi:hypothetical protein